MLKPFGSFSLPGTVASLSAAAGIGGGATGASFMAPSVFGRPISGEPGGSGCAAAGAAARCWAAAGQGREDESTERAGEQQARRVEDRNAICRPP